MLARPAPINVPPFPPTAAKLVRVLSRSDTFGRALELLQEDPLFTAGLIEWANETFPEFGGDIEDPWHVITLAGFERFRSLAPEIAARMYLRGAPVYAELAPLWRYAEACAASAREIAAAEGFTPSRASVAAFLHDLGRIGLTAAHPAKYAAFLADAGARLASGQDVNLAQRERELFNCSRWEAGEWLARTWHFPDEVGLAAGRFAHNERQAPVLIGIVRRACLAAREAGYAILPRISPAPAALPTGSRSVIA
jgi:HD-like signal output (HDOD) protein